MAPTRVLIALAILLPSVSGLSVQKPDGSTSDKHKHHKHSGDLAASSKTETDVDIEEAQPTGRPSKNQSAAETSGVAENAAGDLNAFIAALITNCVTICIFWVIASHLRRRYPEVYQKQCLTLKNEEELKGEYEDAPEDIKKFLDEEWETKVPWRPDDRYDETYFNWWHASADVTTAEVIQYRGLDIAMVLKFNETAMKILGALAIPLTCVMGPCHCFLGGYRAGAPGTKDADYLSYWGMANVVDLHPWLYWAHAFMAWFVIFTVQGLVFSAMREFLNFRNEWLKALPAPRCTTILVEGIPEDKRHDDKLKEYFNDIFGKDVVKTCFVVKQTSTLQNLIADRDATEADVEKLKHAMKEPGGDTEANKEKLVALEDNLENQGLKVVEERKRILQEAADEKESTEPVINLQTAFVTFHARRDAELAKMMVFTPNAEEYVVSIPPDPTDIIYTDLQKDPMKERVKQLIGYGLIFGVYWAYLPTVVSIGYFTSIETLAEYSDAFKAIAEDEATAALWDGMVNALALQLFMGFVPTFFVLIFTNFFILKAAAWLQHKIQDWYFYFQVVFILLVTAVGSSLMATLSELAQNPLSVFALLASTLPHATHFYLNYLPLQWVTHAQNMMRTANLGKYKAFSFIFGKAIALRKAEPEDQDYYGIGSRTARHAFMLVLTLCFCSLSPLIIVLGFVNAWMCRKCYGWLCVFVEIKKPDLGGVFYVTQLNHIQQGMYIYLVLMVGVLLERDASMWPGLIAAGALIFHNNSYNRFKANFRWESLTFEELRTLETPKESNLVYEQPELLEGK